MPIIYGKKIPCGCGGRYTHGNKTNHFKTKTHQRFLIDGKVNQPKLKLRDCQRLKYNPRKYRVGVTKKQKDDLRKKRAKTRATRKKNYKKVLYELYLKFKGISAGEHRRQMEEKKNEDNKLKVKQIYYTRKLKRILMREITNKHIHLEIKKHKCLCGSIYNASKEKIHQQSIRHRKYLRDNEDEKTFTVVAFKIRQGEMYKTHCECGSVYNSYQEPIHLNSKRHQRYLLDGTVFVRN